MKKIQCLLFFIALISQFFGISATAKTTLANSQALFSSVSPELIAGFRNDRTYAAFTGKDSALQVAVFGGTSTQKTKDNLCSYFFPHNQTCLLSVEDGPQDNFTKTKNLLAQNFNIFTKNGDFSSEITLEPRQSVIGAGVHFRQSIIHDPFLGLGFWWSFSVPVLQVRNAINLTEKILSDGGGINSQAGVAAVGSMQCAFMQPAWLYGKMSNTTLKKAGLGDIELKIGYDQYVATDPCNMEFYTGLIIPSSNKNSAQFVFEPILGRGHHAGIMLGGAFGTDIFKIDATSDIRIRWEVALHGEYLFPNTQWRSMDLVDKQWSRYLPVYHSKEQAQEAARLSVQDPVQAQNSATPGINVFTQQVKVSPRFSADSNGAFVIYYHDIRTEVGYNMFIKNEEKVRLSCEWQPVVALKYFEGAGQTNPIRDITGSKYLEQVVENDHGQTLIPVSVDNFDESLIYCNELDKESAQTPQFLSHTVYMAAGRVFSDVAYVPAVYGGFSYTFSHDKGVVQRCLLWLKGTVSF